MKKLYKAVDLRSDTLTTTTKEDLKNIEWDKIGDDCYGEDRLVKQLEETCSDLFGKEAGLFMPSGTMSNQVALRCLIKNEGEEVITEVGYHINFFESAQSMALSRAILNTVKTEDGILRLADIQAAINVKARWTSACANPGAVWLENSINTYGGRIFPYEELKKISDYCKKNDLTVFMDGARLLNACAATGISPKEYSTPADMINICFSKGLGAPMGSMLLGNKKQIKQAKIYRKWYGGGLHQSGLMAGIALNKLADWKSRMIQDSESASLLASLIENHIPIAYPAETNMVTIHVPQARDFVTQLQKFNVKALAWTSETLRFTTSSLVDKQDIIKASEIILTVYQEHMAKNKIPSHTNRIFQKINY